MEEDDGDLVLNLTTTGWDDGHIKQKVTGNRGQRIRARKAARLLDSHKPTDDEQINSDNGNDPKQSTQPLDGATNSSFSENRTEQRAKGPIISSLFNKNPRIPTLRNINVTPVKEQVFSSRSFSDLNLHPYMVSNLENKLGLEQMTAVQSLSIPVLLEGQDVLIKSQTGSGKTLAYAIPVIQSLQLLSPRIRREDGPYAVVVVPTRELALQSQDTFQKLVRPFVWIVAGCLMGGEKRKAEKARLRKGINVLVATPGRLLDHIEHTNSLEFSNVRWVVLDEADRLLDMGYEKDVARIINALNEKPRADRQTVMLSATLTSGVERLAGITLNSPVRIAVSEEEEKNRAITGTKCQLVKNTEVLSASTGNEPNPDSDSSSLHEGFTVPEKLKQHYVIVPCKLRLVTMAAFILSKCKFVSSKSKMIVFMATQDSVEFHHQMFDAMINLKVMKGNVDSGMDSDEESLVKKPTPVIDFYKLHGEMPQKERTQVYHEFSLADSGVLLCTDVAARGLDLPGVQWIVQYTSPGGAAEYIHRVGRTARAGALGHSLLFIMPHEVDYIKTLNSQKISLSELAVSEVLKTLLYHVRDVSISETSKREVPRTYEEAATFMQLNMEESLLSNKELFQLAEKAYQSFIRAYSTYPGHLKSIFHVKHLHLGHVAKSFALRDTPKVIGVGFTKLIASSQNSKRKHHNKITFRDDGDDSVKKRKQDMSEFGSGKAGKIKFFKGPGVRKRKKQLNK